MAILQPVDGMDSPRGAHRVNASTPRCAIALTGSIVGPAVTIASGSHPMLTRQVGLAGAILGANLRSPDLPYKVTFVATYHCNFRCEMCNIWQKKSVNEMTPDEVALFFEPLAAVQWVHLTGGELFMRRDLDDLVAAIQKSCRVAVPAQFPDDRVVRRQDRRAGRADAGRGVGRLMITISIDGPKALHEEMRGLPGQLGRAASRRSAAARHQAARTFRPSSA